MRRGRVVVQRDEWGCGVACVASLLGLSYNEARRRLVREKGRRIDEAPAGLSYRAIKAVLGSEDVVMTRKARLPAYPVGTIVFLSRKWGRYRGSLTDPLV